MAVTFPERLCNRLGCVRAVRRSPSGRVVYAYCDADLSALQTGAFGTLDREQGARVTPPFSPGTGGGSGSLLAAESAVTAESG